MIEPGRQYSTRLALLMPNRHGSRREIISRISLTSQIPGEQNSLQIASQKSKFQVNGASSNLREAVSRRGALPGRMGLIETSCR